MLRLLAPFCFCFASIGFADRPNLVVILVDDMGFSDIGCYGSEIPTPNIDRLAAGGLRYTQFYNTGRCCPTRASILTGQYSHAAGIGHMTSDRGDQHPGYRGRLNNSCATSGALLSAVGYRTVAVGKWHVGHSTKSMWPLQRGFDRFYGIPEGGGFYYDIKPGRSISLGNDVVYSPENRPPADWYSTEQWGDWAVDFIDESIADDKPFFLYLAHNAPHFPLQAPAETIAKYRGKYLGGWDRLREQRLARQRESSLLGDEVVLTPRPKSTKPWSETEAEAERDRCDHIMAAYAATMDELDKSIGQLVSHLKDAAQLDNTLILFMSDNGASAEGGEYGRLKGDPPGSSGSSVYAGKAWATLSNTPFRRHKKSNHEGGIATPMIAHWPNGITDVGTDRSQVAHVIDVVPTLLELAGAEYPTELDGRTLRPIDGVSIVSTFASDSKLDREVPLFWQHESNKAIRDGEWKLVSSDHGLWELYNLSVDRTEMHDIADDHPQQVERLTKAWDQWADSVGVEMRQTKKRSPKTKNVK